MNLERKTIAAMIRVYCRGRHGTRHGLCAECAELLSYAEQRIEKCPFAAEKPTCENCAIHCYKPEMRERAKTVMRFAGPRMMTRHPLLAIRHLWRARRYSGMRSK